MSSPVSCASPASQSSYCHSVFSYHGHEHPRSPGDMTNITTPDSATPKELLSPSPLMFGSPSPSLSAADYNPTMPIEVMQNFNPLPPATNGYYQAEYCAQTNSPPMSTYLSTAPYPQECYWPQPSTSIAPANTNLYPSQFISNNHQYQISSSFTYPSASRTSRSAHTRNRRCLPPIDPTRYEEEVWFTPSGKKVRHSAMHLHCATM
ncbi:hypothetical protein BDZ91DRAFT_166474 [Kalaharituber pfeilii]|nr:hypothetical protein BDZ91DRAFT_166474 [Kalaharituber pfeilii]